MTTINRFLWNSATSYVNLAISFASSFVMVPITLYYLGKEHYGLLQLVGSLASYVSLASLGTGTAIMRTVAQSRSADPPRDINPTVSTAFFFYLFLGIAALATGLSLISVLPDAFHIEPDQRWLSQLVILISFVGAMVTFPLSVFIGVLTGRERFDVQNIIRSAQAILVLVGGVLVFWAGGRLVVFVVVQTAITAAAAIAVVWFAYKEIPTLRLSYRLVRWSELREILSFGIFAFCVQVAVQISYRTDAVVIGMFLPLGAIAVYNIGLRLSEIARDIPAQIGGLLSPVIARIDKDKQPDEVRQILIGSTKWILVVAFAVNVPLLVFARPFIMSWLGPGFHEATLITQVLCVAGIIATGQGPAATVLMHKGRHRLMAMTSLAGSASNLILSIVLVRRFGIFGVALGTLIPVLVADGFLVIPLGCRLIRLPVGRFLQDAVFPPAIPAMAAMLLGMVLQRAWSPYRLIETILAMGVIGGVYLLLFALVFLSPKDRRQYLLNVRGTIQCVIVPQTKS